MSSQPRLRSSVLALLVLLALIASACGSTATETTAAAPADSATEEVADGVSDGARLLVGEFTTVDGETVNLADYQGQDVVFWFWAPW